jgi:leader peptidase (prepilin peptidase) / N-methyltransferase
MNADLLFYIFYTLLGLVIGSFLNVCICRIPLGKSVVSPRSACPHCGVQIRSYDNIPVLSYLLLRGKCRSCKAPISMEYPMVELLTAAAFFACAWRWEFASPTFVNSLFLSLIIILVFTDYHHQLLNNVVTLPGLAAGILLSPFQSFSYYLDSLSMRLASLIWPENPVTILPWVGSVAGAIVGAAPLLLIGIGYERLRHRQGLGMGDVKMMAMVGAFLGPTIAFLTIFAGSLLGSFVGISFMISGRMNLQSKLAFGIYLGIASALLLFFGLPLWNWYGQFWHNIFPR